MAHLWAWFVGAVWPNLVASMIWGTPAGALFAWHHRHLKAHHRRELQGVKAQHTEDLRKQRIHFIKALAEVRDQVLGAIGEQQQPADGPATEGEAS